MKRLLVVPVVGSLCACPVDVPAVEGSSGTGSSGGVSVGETGVVSASVGESGSTDATPTSGGVTTGHASTGELDGSGTSTTGTGDASSGGSSGSGDSGSEGGPVCGDGVVEGDEACDDGNDDPNDACLGDCTPGPTETGVVVDIELLAKEEMTCFTLAADGLALAGYQVVNTDQGKDMYGHVKQVPLPDGAPEGWSYLEKAGDAGRWPRSAATASNGDVIIAGVIYTEFKQPDSGGYPWLARFTPAGALVWSVENKQMFAFVQQLALGPGDAIVTAGYEVGLGGSVGGVMAFSGEGVLQWQVVEGLEELQNGSYTGLALGADGAVFVTGTRSIYEIVDMELVLSDQWMLVRGFSAAGAPLWSIEEPVVDAVGTYPGAMVRTADDRLVVHAGQQDLVTHESLPGHLLMAYNTAGVKLGTTKWIEPGPWAVSVKRMLATDDGGVYFAGGGVNAEDQKSTFLGRFAADGTPTWLKFAPGTAALDALIGLDARVYMLRADSFVSFPP